MVVDLTTLPESKEEIDNDHPEIIHDADKNTKEGSNSSDDCNNDEELKLEDSPKSIRNKNMKKAGVAVVGGALITAGIPLIPVLCAGELMIIGGMALLATEFDSAKNILDKGREKLTQFALKDDEDVNSKSIVNEVDEKEVKTSDHEKILFENNHEKENEFPINKKNDVDQKFRNVSNNVQRSLRKMVKKDILPIIDKFAPKEEKCHKNLI